MRQNKIILFDAPQFGSDRDSVTIEHQPDSDYFYFIGYSGMVANIIKPSLPNNSFEVWRLDNRIDKLRTREIRGILGKIYPLRCFLSKDLTYNAQLISELWAEAKGCNLVFVFSGIHSFFYILLSMLFRRIPKIVIQLGGANSYYKYKISKSKVSLLYSLIERKLYIRNIDHARLFTEAEKQYFLKETSPDVICDFPVLPVDLTLMQPIDKNTARKYLNISPEDKFIYQTGRAFSNKGTDITISVWLRFLKDKGIKLILTGIHESDELYDLVKSSGVDFRPVVPRDDLPYWYSAADVYLYPPFDDETLNFGGYGLAPLEALACGTPVVGTTMINFPDFEKNKKRIKEVCIIPKNEEEIASGVFQFLNCPPSRESCRSLVKDYFSKESVADSLTRTISEIYNRRYSKINA
ncbi:MAG: glycosyltransferase family 4 protein [Bacteroidales bacterium]